MLISLLVVVVVILWLAWDESHPPTEVYTRPPWGPTRFDKDYGGDR